MKSVIAFACLLAVASAGYINAPIAYAAAPIAYAAYDDGSYKGEGLYESAYKGEGLLESQDYASAPIAVAARVAVAAPIAVAAPVVARGSSAVAYNAPLVAAPHPINVARTYAYAAPYTYATHYAHAYAAPLASEARLIDPVAIAAGAPLPTGDTVEVAAAKAAHLQAHAAAKGLAYAAPIAHTVAAPIAVARTSSAVAYNAPLVSAPHPINVARTYAYATPYAHTYATPYAHTYATPYANTYAYATPLVSEARQVDPVAIAAGAPLPTGDTVEVAAAKAFHHQAHLNAKATHFAAKGHYIAKRSPGYLGAAAYATPVHSYGYSSIAAPLAYSAYNTYGYGRFGSYYL